MSSTTAKAAFASPKLRLWVLTWGLYPRRVTIYLKEKGILDNFDIIPVNITSSGMGSAPGKPPGTMPILETARPSGDGNTPGHYIFESIAILEYLEERYGDRKPCMLGSAAEERAHSRDLLSILNEAVAFASRYVHNASAVFSAMEAQSADGGRVCLERVHMLLSQLEGMAGMEGPFLVRGQEQQPTIVDCVVMAMLQFSNVVYGVNLADEKKHPRLGGMYQAFGERESAVWDEMPPAMLVEVAKNMSVR